MHQLLLLRHAKSSWDSPDLPDRERPLNPRGRRAAGLMRQAVRDLGLVPDIVLVSAARRTRETLALLEPWDETPLVEEMDSLYLAPAAHLLDVLRGVTETARSVMMVGHNPGLHELALSLLGPPTAEDRQQAPLLDLLRGFPSGALAEFVVPGPWSRLNGGGVRLQRFITPRSLERTH
jgi:phosphohistidine phosphatase